jgi:hypothetical protein
MLAETHAEGRQLERTLPIDAQPVNGGARRIDRWSWAKRQVSGVDDDVFVVRIRDHYRRDKCLVTEVVREECTPGLGPGSRAAVQIPRDSAFRDGDSELQQFAVDPRSAPRQFSAAIRRIRSRQGESMRGLPGRRERRRQHRRTRSRCQRSTVAGWISTSASRHRGHNHRKNNQNRRSAGRKRLFERARTPSWWRRARVSSRRSRRVARADRTAAPVLMTARIACRVPAGDANVNDFWPHAILARHSERTAQRATRRRDSRRAERWLRHPR